MKQIYILVCWFFSGTLFFASVFAAMPTFFRVWSLLAALVLLLIGLIVAHITK